VVDKGSGAQVQVTIPSSISSTSTTRFDFVSWSDGSTAPTRQVDINQDTVNIYATYQAAFLLTTASNPAGGAAFKTSPESADGFYATGTQVTVTATPKDGYKFVRWEGDLSGAYASGTLTMSTPHAVIADLVSVPFIPPAGIQTAAGPTPDGSVGPGSIISIYGNSLAAAFQVGPTNPLAQTIGDVTVTVNGQLLPLLFVSPDQIAAQLPWELADGDYTLQVHALGQPDVPGKFTVSRDAPAIFTYPETDADPTQPPLLLALHEDGSVITRTSPARHNEQISIYGTGFGPYDRLIPAGFSVSTTDNYKLVDPVQVTVDTLQVTPAWAGPATSMVGMNIVKLKITDAMPSATTVNLTVAVNGKTSSPVALPLQ
jgi:uncharacterized protein (TIGR03437 family)